MSKLKSEKLEGTEVETPADVAAITEDPTVVEEGPRRTRRILLMLLVPLLLLGGGVYYWLSSQGTVSTDNAAVKQDIVSVSAQVNGPIVDVRVKNGDHVRRGDLLFRIDPAPFRAEVEPRLVPLYLYKTPETFVSQMEANVREALAEGLAGWQVTDCIVTMTDCGYASPVTSAADFRRLTQLVMMTALERAGTWVCEPLADVSLEVPASTAQAVIAALGRLGGRVTGQFSANGVTRAAAVLPVARVRSLQHQLPGLSMGEGVLEWRPGGYQPIGDNPPTRPRSAPSPLDRDAWLASSAKRGI